MARPDPCPPPPAPGGPPLGGPPADTAGGRASRRLSPWPLRLAVYALLVLLALASIRLIDRRAMARMKGLQAAPAPAGQR